jgi:hypothetical protein
MSDPSQYGATANLRKAALGYLRTYFYLIQYESDQRIAQDSALCLVAKEVTWPQFCQSTARFNHITENEVSGRYHYGEIRLTRLNYCASILLRRSHYQRENYQYRAYFARIQGLLISEVCFFLNCPQLYAGQPRSLFRSEVFKCFFICRLLLDQHLIISMSGPLVLILIFLFLFKVVREWRFAIAHRLRWKKNPQQRPPEGHV